MRTRHNRMAGIGGKHEFEERSFAWLVIGLVEVETWQVWWHALHCEQTCAESTVNNASAMVDRCPWTSKAPLVAQAWRSP